MKPDYTALEFPPPPADRPYVIVNMVMSADGHTILGGSEQGIGSKADQRLMRELRVHADVILNGATTLRVSGTSPRTGDPLLEALRVKRGKPKAAIGAVISRSGHLPLDRIFFTADDFEAMVYLSHDAPKDAAAKIIETGRAVATLPATKPIEWMLAHMRHEVGANLLLCEGGATLNGQVLAAGAVDELFITIGPRLVAGRNVPGAIEGQAFTKEDAPRLELVAVSRNEETSELYLRYRVLPAAGG